MDSAVEAHKESVQDTEQENQMEDYTVGETELEHDLKYTELAFAPTARGLSDILSSLEPDQKLAIARGFLAFYFMFYVLLTLPVLIVYVLNNKKETPGALTEIDSKL